MKLVERGVGNVENTREEVFPAGRVLWFEQGSHRGIINTGRRRFGQVNVELK